ncbi:MAG: gluconolaconase [Acidobacteriia bacterium]|nr:gluconolaconase [Terriglobia bacterium]
MALRKNNDSRPQIAEVSPFAAIPGGEFQIRGKGLAPTVPAHVRFGDVQAPIVIGSDSLIIARVPENAQGGELVVGGDGRASVPWTCGIGIQVADSVHPVSNPVVDRYGNIYTTFSGSAGQKTPVSIYQIDTNYRAKPLVTDLMNATGLALDPEGVLYVSSRHDGIVYQVSHAGNLAVYVEGMGVATGIAFDHDENLYVGDRSGTVFKISRQRQIYVFATLEPSIAAYHLAFGPDDYLYVTGPTTSSFDAVHRISRDGHVETFYRGLGRPQGMAFDVDGNLYVAASLGGRRGVVRLDSSANAELFLSGPAIVGLAFGPGKSMVLATNNSIYKVDAGIEGRKI